MKNKVLFFQAGSEVVRYHTLTTLINETVGHHSHGVALFCHLIDPHCSRDLLVAALTHDLAEHVTGDIPSPSKRLYGVADQVSVLESSLMSDVGFDFPDLTKKELRVLKLADLAQGALFCAREVSLGNWRMQRVLDRYISYAAELTPVGIEQEIFDIIKGEAL